jgi:purine-binding chemotaxis protein CheW
VIPVLDVRRRSQLPAREIGVADRFVIARTEQRMVALAVDDVDGVIEREQADVMNSNRIAPGLAQYQGVAKFEDGLVLIYDLDKFLSLDETRTLDQAMDRGE